MEIRNFSGLMLQTMSSGWIRLGACLMVIVLYSVNAFSQNRISGRVIHEASGEPVPYASVYFANTTFGSSTDNNGNFLFTNFPPGKYDLSVTFVGYKPHQQAVEFGTDQSLQVDIVLSELVTELYSVTVKPDTTHWRRNYEEFTYHFLGTSRYAENAIIRNASDIHLFYDAGTATLVAHARNPIIIDNTLTGYRIYYHLHHFEYVARERILTIFGIPRFERLQPKSAAEQKRWERNRKAVYEGSMLHFTRAWLAQQWQEQGFRVARLYRIPNKERPSDEFLTAKINALRKQLTRVEQNGILPLKGNSVLTDSLTYYAKLRDQPREIDSVANESLSGAEFTMSASPEFKNFQGILQVTYRKNEELRYAESQGRSDTIRKQQSVVHILQPLKLYGNGYYEDVKSMFIEQYWSWSEKISTLLPLDYEPPLGR
ncbi:MAG: carboxypeptidase-like regulatory domain-containing protein [Cyclobacteriaceae bacterium]|jgi:hypothetical protein|nr:carboxypeptidase-like regulatory domain-containing protein [Cyclobacteriaceae bacterium]